MSANPNNKNFGHLFIGPFLFHFDKNSFLLAFINKGSVHTDQKYKLASQRFWSRALLCHREQKGLPQSGSTAFTKGLDAPGKIWIKSFSAKHSGTWDDLLHLVLRTRQKIQTPCAQFFEQPPHPQTHTHRGTWEFRKTAVLSALCWGTRNQEPQSCPSRMAGVESQAASLEQTLGFPEQQHSHDQEGSRDQSASSRLQKQICKKYLFPFIISKNKNLRVKSSLWWISLRFSHLTWSNPDQNTLSSPKIPYHPPKYWDIIKPVTFNTVFFFLSRSYKNIISNQYCLIR